MNFSKFGKCDFCRYLRFLLVFLIFVYFTTKTYPFGYFNVTCYEELADAFMAGHTDLLRDPPAGLLALPDPWDPKTNKIYRDPPDSMAIRFDGVDDLALYNGRLYLQWGPLPALAIIPLRWVLGPELPMGRLGLLAETLAALAFYAATLRLAGMAGFRRSCVMSTAALLTFLLCPIWTFTVRRIAAYELAIFFGQLCLGLSLLSVVSAFEARLVAGQKKFWRLGLGGVLLGCAVNCRLDLAPLGLMVPVLTYIWWRLGPAARNWKQMAGPALCLGGPAAFLLACALLYNKIRFDDFFEVGQSWQLWGGNESARLHKFHFVETARFLPNIWYEFLSPFMISAEFPFLAKPVAVDPASWLSADRLAAYGPYIGWTSGLFVTMPITVLALLFPFVRSRGSVSPWSPDIRWVTILLMLTGLLGGILPFLTAALMRYEAEWCMWWVAASILVTWQIRAGLQRGKWRFGATLFEAALLLSVAWSSWIGMSFVLFPAYDP